MLLLSSEHVVIVINVIIIIRLWCYHYHQIKLLLLLENVLAVIIVCCYHCNQNMLLLFLLEHVVIIITLCYYYFSACKSFCYFIWVAAQDLTLRQLCCNICFFLHLCLVSVTFRIVTIKSCLNGFCQWPAIQYSIEAASLSFCACSRRWWLFPSHDDQMWLHRHL